MKKIAKRMLSLLLSLALLVSMGVTTVFASGNTVRVSTKMESVTTRTDGEDIYKLVLDLYSPNGVSAMSFMLSYDNALIVPVAYVSNYIDLPEKSDSYITFAMQTLLKTQPLMGEGVSYTVAGIKYYEKQSTSTSRSAILYDIYAANDPITTMVSAQAVVEFYFRIADDKSINDLVKGTFKIETDKSADSFLAMHYTEGALEDASGLEITDKAISGDTTYTYAGSQSDTIDLSLVYIGSNKQTLDTLTLAADPTSVTVNGTDVQTVTLTPTATDTEGDAYPVDGIAYTLNAGSTSATLNGSTITIPAKAQAGSISVTAMLAGKTSEAVTITVSRATAAASSVEVTGVESIEVPTVDTPTTQTYTAKVTDQFGDAMTGQSVTWSITPASQTGVSFDSAGSILSVSKAAAENGAVSVMVKAEAGGISGMKTVEIKRAASVVTGVRVALNPDAAVTVPPLGEAAGTVQATATVTDQYGKELTGQAITWSLTNAPNGVSIDSTGKITVAPAARAGSVTVTAVCGGKEGTAALTVSRAAPAATSVELHRNGSKVGTADTLVIPAQGSKPYAYTAKVLDQYGDVMNGGTAAWTFTPAAEKVTFDHAENVGTVTISAGAAKDTTYALTAKYGGVSATTAITVKDIEITWPAVTTQNLTYGFTWGQMVSLSGGSASINGETVAGTFTVKDADTRPAAGAQTYTVNFPSVDGAYNIDNSGAQVTIAAKPITVTVTTASREYGANNPSFDFTVPNGALVGSDTKAGLGLTLRTAAVTDSVPGQYTVTGTASNTNYAVTVSGTNALTITKAVLTRTGEPLALGEILASAEMDADALLAAVKAKNPTLAATYCKGASQTMLEVSWALKSGTYDPKGGTYCYEGTLTPADPANFSYSGGTVTLDVAVTPVTGSVVWTVPALTKAKSEVTGAASVSALLGVGETVTVDYDHGVADGPYPITGWTPALETLKGYDVSTADKTVDVAPTVTFPAWATIDTSAMKTALTITNKFQVTVTATAPGDITYGAALGDPSASQTAGAHGTDASGTYTYCYEGSGSTDYGPSAEKPVNAGTYTVTATLVSDTHAGISAPAAFAIGKKALTEGMLTITGTYVYTGSSITPSYTVADGALLQESDYTAAVTNNVNAAKSDGASAPTVTITAAENGNYSGSLSKTFTIAPKSIAGVSVDGYSSSYTYTGAAIQPGVHVKDGGKTLVKDTDYTLRYGANTQTKDGGTITLEGKGNYTGSTQPYSFAITPAPARGIVSISGTCTVGNTVSAAVFEAAVGDAPAYQWYRDGAAIEGADQASYTLTGADAGARITVAVTAGGNYTGVLTSAAVTVGKIDIGSSGYRLDVRQEPVSSAAPAVGSTLVAQPGHTDGPQHHDPKDYDLVWARDGQELPPATPTDKYVVTKADRGHALRAKLVGKGSYTGELWSDPIHIPADRPDAPVVTAAAGSGLVTLKWTCDDAGAPITNYLLTLPDGAVVTLSGSTTGYTASGLTNGQRYTFTVRAVNGLGTGDAGSASATPTSDSGGGSWSGGSTVTTYTITVKQSVGGEIAPETTKVKRGADQTFRITPDDGYAIADVLVDGKSVGAVSKYTFENVKAAHTIQAVFEEAGGSTPRVTFSDVDGNGWAAEYIYFLAGREIVGGVGGGLFAPQRAITRAEFVKILAGVAGAGEAQTDSTRFTDVAPGSWYAPYVAWAVEHGVTTGTSATTFAPDDTITREQMAAMIYRYASSAGVTLPKTRDAVRFSDASGFSGWAIEAIDALTRAGILDGVGAGRFAPQESATREQACKMLALLLQIIEEA